MRVTQETRKKTRKAILDAARDLFEEVGFAAATTRQIASAAKIATGTLFNYFPSKEVLGLALVREVVEAGKVEFEAKRRNGEALEETLFAHVAIQLRHLSPFRAWVGDVFDAALSPLRVVDEDGRAGDLRGRHLERVAEWLTDVEPQPAPESLTINLHLYWSLYLGVVSFWVRDESHNQEGTLAFLDRSIGLFCRALREE